MFDFNDLKQRIANKTVTAAVIGLGYVGLPLVNAMCAKGIRTYGFDVDQTKINALLNNQSYIDAVSSSSIKQWNTENLLSASTDFSELTEADFIIICVPTPLNDDNDPDLSYVVDTTKAIAKHLRKGQIIVLESTTYPGTTTEIVKPILESTGLVDSQDFYLAYSPERENPGSADFDTSSITKIIGADHPQALELSQEFYEIFIDKMIPVSSMAVAEASKITENIFRSVNIALVNEFKMIYDRMGIDVWEVIDAASTKPFGYMPFYPGPGLGGHCIPIDPFYLSWKAKQVGTETRFIELAGEINTAMPNYVLNKTKKALDEKRNKALKDCRILIIGVAYKKNVNDQRETPALPFMSELIKEGSTVDFYDPHIPQVKPNRNFPNLTDMNSIQWDKKQLSSYDCAVIITDHDGIEYKDLIEAGCLIVDTRNTMKNHTDNPQIIKA